MSDIFNLRSVSNNNPFGLATDRGSLRASFNAFIKKRPNWVVYVRVDERYPCDYCYEPGTDSRDTSCEECFGQGFKVQFEKHECRRSARVREAESPMEEFGYLSNYEVVYYSPRYYYPKSKDVYLEVEWDVGIDRIEQYGKPVGLVSAHRVDEAVAFREDEVTYMASCCNQFNFNRQTMEEWVKRLGQIYVTKKVI